MFDNKLIEIQIFLDQTFSNINFYKDVFSWIKNYLNISVKYIFVNDNNFINHVCNNVSFYFIDYEVLNKYKLNLLNFIYEMKKTNHYFQIIFILNLFSKNDFWLFKKGADDIIYLDKNSNWIKWKFLSIIRRHIKINYENIILMKNGICIDLVLHKVFVNKKEIYLTKKEFQLLVILVDEFYKINKFISKQKIFKLMYNDNGLDNTRIIDQLIFKLKNKIGKEFFLVKNKGIRIM